MFWKSVDASDVDSRNTEYYFQLLDKVVDEIGEECVVQVVTDNEAALKAAGHKLMEKRPHLYWSSFCHHNRIHYRRTPASATADIESTVVALQIGHYHLLPPPYGHGINSRISRHYQNFLRTPKQQQIGEAKESSADRMDERATAMRKGRRDLYREKEAR
ncbi:unnamed protein product [Trifolium pratense]|uniref:Uncharacterized protein n=1 Tax=Trifolium pratense TaxID=57577 RepID=A0ACB0LE62_TRIPR|nr:unnamed protein product [Trifolium pratense]